MARGGAPAQGKKRRRSTGTGVVEEDVAHERSWQHTEIYKGNCIEGRDEGGRKMIEGAVQIRVPRPDDLHVALPKTKRVYC